MPKENLFLSQGCDSTSNAITLEWTSAKVGHPRYFCYWHSDALKSLLESKGFNIIESAKDEKFLQVIARSK